LVKKVVIKLCIGDMDR